MIELWFQRIFFMHAAFSVSNRHRRYKRWVDYFINNGFSSSRLTWWTEQINCLCIHCCIAFTFITREDLVFYGERSIFSSLLVIIIVCMKDTDLIWFSIVIELELLMNIAHIHHLFQNRCISQETASIVMHQFCIQRISAVLPIK